MDLRVRLDSASTPDGKASVTSPLSISTDGFSSSTPKPDGRVHSNGSASAIFNSPLLQTGVPTIPPYPGYDVSSALNFLSPALFHPSLSSFAASRNSPLTLGSIYLNSYLTCLSRRTRKQAPSDGQISQASTPPPPPTKSSRSGRSRADAASEGERDDSYWDRRRKNNEAAKRSRNAKRQKEEEVRRRVAFLEQENLKLGAQIAILRNESVHLRYLLYSKTAEGKTLVNPTS